MSLIFHTLLYIITVQAIIKLHQPNWIDQMTNTNIYQYLDHIIFEKGIHYVNCCLEEMIFRLPLLYFPQWIYFFALAFALQQYQQRSTYWNLINSFILGLLWSYILLEDGITVPILLHTFNNFLAAL